MIKRILHVVRTMNRGGAETLIMNLYRAMDRDRVQFDFALEVGEEGHYDNEIMEMGGRLFYLPVPAQVGLREYSSKLAEVIRSNGPFAGVHSHVHYLSGIVAYIAQKEGVPIRIVHSHTTRDGRPDTWLRQAYRNCMQYLIKRYATHMTGCSVAACAALFGDTALNKDSRAFTARNAFNLDSFREVKERQINRFNFSLPAKGFLLGHLGNFRPEKNHQFILDVFNKVQEQVSDAYLILGGDGPLRSEIRARVVELGLQSRVFMPGSVSNTIGFLNSIDVLVFPSLYEGLGSVVVEAQMAGVPCVISPAIPTEADLGLNLIQPIILDIQSWVDAVIKANGKEKVSWENRYQAAVNAEYDIKVLAKRLEEIYVS
ncbi:MAG: glycosyltransferase [Chitinophagales bacterium]